MGKQAERMDRWKEHQERTLKSRLVHVIEPTVTRYETRYALSKSPFQDALLLDYLS